MKLSKDSPMQKLLDTLPQEGKVVWIGIRPERKSPLFEKDKVEAITDSGLKGDHYSGKKGSKRQITLIQKEHIDAISSYLLKEIHPGQLRRNIVVKGINLLALKDKQFMVGETLLKFTGECHPCSRMEENLGPGGYNATRGHGGITAQILKGGTISVNDTIKIIESLE